MFLVAMMLTVDTIIEATPIVSSSAMYPLAVSPGSVATSPTGTRQQTCQHGQFRKVILRVSSSAAPLVDAGNPLATRSLLTAGAATIDNFTPASSSRRCV